MYVPCACAAVYQGNSHSLDAYELTNDLPRRMFAEMAGWPISTPLSMMATLVRRPSSSISSWVSLLSLTFVPWLVAVFILLSLATTMSWTALKATKNLQQTKVSKCMWSLEKLVLTGLRQVLGCSCPVCVVCGDSLSRP